MEYSGAIIDSHMHLWDLNNDYQWLKTNNSNVEKLIGNYDKIKKNFLASDYIKLFAKFNVTKAVHLQAIGFLDNPVLETMWLQQQFDTTGMPNAIIAHADLTLPNIEQILLQHCQYSNMRGIRMILNYHEIDYLCMADRGDYMQDKCWQSGFSLLEKYNLLFEAQIFPYQIDDLFNLAQKYPRIMIILEHFCWPLDCSADGFIEWQKQMKKISQCENIMFKLSNLVNRAFLDVAVIKRYIHEAINIFGANRCMFGSNCPPDTIRFDIDTIMHIYKSACAIYPLDWQQQIFHDNAARVYNI